MLLHSFGSFYFFGAATIGLLGVYAAPLLNDDVSSLKEAREKLAPLLPTVKKIDASDIEFLVKKGWWELADELVSASHEQKADLSFAIRKGVSAVRTRADELIRSLNPKYNEKKQVIPVFRWAQNDTSIFLTIKYSVKWDAPGAVNVKDPAVTFNEDGTLFQFKAYGEHSGNKYEYTLDLDCFDKIMPRESTWSSASVGRFTAILAKRRSRKWPRLLLDKKKKGTGRLDLTRQEEFDKNQMNGATLVSHSERSCAAVDKVYCPSKDNCHTDCSTCTDRTHQKDEFCTGAPKKGVSSIKFTDVDMRKGFIGGTLQIEQVRSEYDVGHYAVKVGIVKKDEVNIRRSEGMKLLGKVPASIRLAEVKYDVTDLEELSFDPANETMAFAVFTENDFGLLNEPVFRTFDDAYLPLTGAQSLSFHDSNGDIGVLSGDISVTPVDPTDTTIEEFALYFGKKSGRKIPSDASIGVTPVNASYKVDTRSVPNGATHILAFAKNKHGENAAAVASLSIVDNTKPCAGKDRKSSLHCPPIIKTVSGDENLESQLITLDLLVEKTKKKLPKDVQFTVYASTGPACDSESNYRQLENMTEEGQSDGTTKLKLVDAVLNPEGESWRYTHLQVYTWNAYGRSKYCTSIPFTDLPKKENQEL